MPDWVVSLDHEKGQNEKGQRKYELHWTIKAPLEVSPGARMNVDTVGSHPDLPFVGSVHDTNLAAYCYDLQVEGGKGQWSAVARYSEERVIKPDPLDDEIEIEFDSESYQEAIHKDIFGKAITNSAGDYYVDPVPTREATHLVFKFTSNQSDYKPWMVSHRDAVNDAAITIRGLTIPQGHAKVKRLRGGKKSYRNDHVYYPILFEIHVHELPWRLQPLDAGFRERDANNKLVQITNEGDDTEPTAPVALDGTSHQLPDPSPDNSVFRDHEIYFEKDFTILPGIA